MTSAEGRGSGSQYAYTELRRRVLSLELMPGTRLFEERVAGSLGVSRTPLREAIRQLTAEGLLERSPTGGIRVPSLNAREVSELYEVRGALEGLMTGTAATIVTVSDIRMLEEIVSRNKSMLDYPDDAMRLGTALHAAIADLSGNAWALRLHEQVSAQLARYRPFSNRSTARRIAALRQHRLIVDCISRGDAVQAASAANAHVLEARDEAVRAIGQVGR